MIASFAELVVLSSVSVAIVGLAAIIAAVRCRGTVLQRCSQRLFTACLVCVGAATILAVAYQDSAWICSAVAYATLAIAATYDGRSTESYSIAQ